MDLRKLKTILELFENSAISEMELSEGEERLRLSKGPSAPPPQVQHLQVAPPTAPPPAPAVPTQDSGEGAAAPQPQAPDGLFELTAPMVGTYYAQASEDADPFVRVGDRVTEGEVVCIIEAMKLFNNVTAPVTGTVEEIVARNAEPVGYGDVIMRFRPD